MDVRRRAFGVFFFRLFATLRPARRHLRALRCVIVFARIWNAFIERHRDIASECRLSFHGNLRRNERSRPIDVILKFDAVLRDFAQFRERKNLKPAAVGQNRPIPIHELVQAAKMLNRIEPRPNE